MLDATGGIALDHSNVRQLCEYLQSKLPFLNASAIPSQFNPAATRTLLDFYSMRARAHPLAVDWYYLQQQIADSERAGTLKFTHQSMFLLDVLIRVSELLNVSGVERLLARIQDPRQFYSAVFEALTLSQYRQLGADIEIVPEQPESGVRRPDFRVKTKQGEVFIECKSLEDFSRRETRIWEQAEARVIKVLQKANRYWRVHISAKRELKGADIEGIRRLTSIRAKENSLKPISSADEMIELKFDLIAEDDKWIQGEVIDLHQKGTRGWGEAEQWSDPLGQKYFRMPVFVQGVPFVSSDDTKRILDDIADAHGQLGSGETGVLHIEVPYRDSERLLMIADAAFQRAFGFLKKRSKIACVVLCARTWDRFVQANGNPIFDYYSIIPNAGSGGLPNDFVVVGSLEEPLSLPKRNVFLGWISEYWQALILFLKVGYFSVPRITSRSLSRILSGGQGSMLIQFGINQPLSEQVGRYLFRFCSRNGRCQINLWQSFSNKFRVDIVDVAFGRKSMSLDLNYLAVDCLHDIAVTWDGGELRVFLDGEKFEYV